MTLPAQPSHGHVVTWGPVQPQGAVPFEALLATPTNNRGFEEGKASLFGPCPGPGWSFFVDDAPLPEVEEAGARCWTWTPGFFAGQVVAELVDPRGQVVEQFLLDVAPHSDKAGRELFQEMLDRVWEEDPALVLGEEPAQSAVGALGEHQDPLLELARLRRYAPGFLKALRDVARNPIRPLRGRRLSVPLNRVRKADRQTALTALRNPDVVAYLTRRTASTSARRSALRLDVPVVERHLDGAANRCLTAILLGVLRRATGLIEQLDRKAAAEQTSQTRTAFGPRWPRRRRLLTELRDDLTRLLRRPPYSAVTRPEVTAAGLNACSAHPVYARAYGLGWRATRRGVEGPPTEEQLWISPTWEIYERWCAVEVARLMRTGWPALEWERLRRPRSGARAHWRGHAHDTVVDFYLQPVFPAGDIRRSGPFRSISGQREPDLVLTVKTPEWRGFLVLDAKYRVSRYNVLDAMSSAHIYRDALRWEGRRPDLCLLLVPAGGGAPWLEKPTFHRAEGVGILVLAPNMTTDHLRAALGQWLGPD